MRNLPTPYACGICETEFYNPVFLIKHVEVRHPTKARNFSSLSTTNIRDTKTDFSNHSKEKSANSRSKNVFDNRFLSINVVEIDPNSKKVKISREPKNGNNNEKNMDSDIKFVDDTF